VRSFRVGDDARAGESAEPPAVNLSDPYLIAYLRGGKNEVLRVATVTLIDRGYLTVLGSRLVAPDRPPTTLRLPIEQRLLGHFAKETEAASVFKSRSFDREMAAYDDELVGLDLVPGAAAKQARNIRAATGILVLWIVAAIKIDVALSRGRSNIQFLFILAILFAVAVIAMTRARQTWRGVAMLGSLKYLFGSLKERSTGWLPRENPSDLLMLAAVFGAATIPTAAFPYMKSLYPKASSGSSSCGSGCGGGGCGGGCGGCGS
jgi:uncharacterized protein (TIGR04222 family)